MDTEDSITLTVTWQNMNDNSFGTAVYTSSWVASRSDPHLQQRFFYMGTKGEINIYQAQRGYTLVPEYKAFSIVNPLFMKYMPTNGKFSGKGSYSVKSFDNFVDAVNVVPNLDINMTSTVEEWIKINNDWCKFSTTTTMSGA